MSDVILTVDTVGDAALCDSIIDRSVTELVDETCTSVGQFALAGADKLRKVHFENVTQIGSDAFQGCTALETISLPKYGYSSSCSFEGLTALKEINMPILYDIRKQYSFMNCTSLKKVDFPALEHIGCGSTYSSGAFADCSLLDTVILRSNTMCLIDNASVFADTPLRNGAGYVYVPAVLIADYEADPNWTETNIQFRAIEDYPDICGT